MTFNSKECLPYVVTEKVEVSRVQCASRVSKDDRTVKIVVITKRGKIVICLLQEGRYVHVGQIYFFSLFLDLVNKYIKINL